MPSFYIPNRYRTGGELAAYLQGCVDGLLGNVPFPLALLPISERQAYSEGHQKGASLRELDL